MCDSPIRIIKRLVLSDGEGCGLFEVSDKMAPVTTFIGDFEKLLSDTDEMYPIKELKSRYLSENSLICLILSPCPLR